MIIYLDDICIASTTFDNHILEMEKVFQRLRKHQVILKLKKCSFLKTQFTYLGNLVKEGNIYPDTIKVKVVNDAKAPRNVKESGYFRKFTKDCSSLVKPLQQLTTLKFF